MVNNIVQKISNVNRGKELSAKVRGEGFVVFFLPPTLLIYRCAKIDRGRRDKYFLIEQIVFFRMYYNLAPKPYSRIQNKMFNDGGDLVSNLIYPIYRTVVFYNFIRRLSCSKFSPAPGFSENLLSSIQRRRKTCELREPEGKR